MIFNSRTRESDFNPSRGERSALQKIQDPALVVIKRYVLIFSIIIIININ